METVKLITSQTFSRDELISALLEIGIQRDESSYHVWDYHLMRGEAIVWIQLDNLENYPDEETDALIEGKLGGPPHSYVIMHISRNEGSERLAMELAIRFTTQWSAVLDNLSGLARRIFTRDELQDLYDHGLGLHEDEKDTPMPEEWYTTDEVFVAPWRLEEMKQKQAKAEVEKPEDLPNL